MALLDIPLDQICDTHLRRLIDAAARESAVIDFKRQTYGVTVASRKEFLADISSLANTAGGDIVIGMSETSGVPQEIVPFEGDSDKEIQRLESMARDGLEPRIEGLRVTAVPVDGGHVLIARTRRSLAGPHRVIFDNGNRFYARSSAGRYQPNVEELRRMFVDGPRLGERLRSLRQKRLALIAADKGPLQFGRGGRLVVHVGALPSIADQRFADVVDRVSRGTHVPLPLTGIGGMAGVNIDGYINLAHGETREQSYALFLREGVIEGVAGLPTDGGEAAYISGKTLVPLVIASVKQYAEVLRSYEAGEPLYAFVAIVDASNTVLHQENIGGTGFSRFGHTVGDLIDLPSVILDPSPDKIAGALRPIFNVMWNAFGFARCDRYNDEGELITGF